MARPHAFVCVCVCVCLCVLGWRRAVIHHGGNAETTAEPPERRSCSSAAGCSRFSADPPQRFHSSAARLENHLDNPTGIPFVPSGYLLLTFFFFGAVEG